MQRRDKIRREKTGLSDHCGYAASEHLPCTSVHSFAIAPHLSHALRYIPFQLHPTFSHALQYILFQLHPTSPMLCGTFLFNCTPPLPCSAVHSLPLHPTSPFRVWRQPAEQGPLGSNHGAASPAPSPAWRSCSAQLYRPQLRNECGRGRTDNHDRCSYNTLVTSSIYQFTGG